MKHLYKVEFEIKYSGIGEWMDENYIHVVANGDGLKAVAAARKIAMKKEFTDGDGTLRRSEVAYPPHFTNADYEGAEVWGAENEQQAIEMAIERESWA